MKKLLKSKWLTVILAVAVCSGGTYYYFQRSGSSESEQTKEIVVEVKKGDIRYTISGTSQLEPKDIEMVIAPSEGTLKTLNLTRNKKVNKGDLLVEISNPTQENNMKKAVATLQQQERTLASLQDQIDATNARAPISGKLSLPNNVDVGFNVVKTTKIATIADVKNLSVTLPFALEEAVQIKVGDIVDLTIDGFLLTKPATVKTISREPRADSKGGKLIDVELSIVNDSTMDAGLKARGSLEISGRTVQSQDVGVLQYSKTVNMLANVAGSIDEVFFKNGAFVEKGDLLLHIANEKIRDDFANQQNSVEQQRIVVADLQEKLDALKLIAPFDGVFSTDFADKKKNILANLTKGSRIVNNTNFGGVASTESMQLPIQVDELDLPVVKNGLKAIVRADSLQDAQFQAEVSQVSTVGSTTNGVTFFDVVLAVKNTNALKYGMTATGEILVQDKKNVLWIPIEALQTSKDKRYVVLKKPDGTVEEQHEVKIGIRSKTQVEIVEGLKEGDKVVVPLSKKQQELSPEEVAKLKQQFENGAEKATQQGGGGAANKAANQGGNAGGGNAGGGNAGGGAANNKAPAQTPAKNNNNGGAAGANNQQK